MDRNEDKRRRKNERDRLAYKRMSAEKKTELLQRRRQQYRQRIERRRNEMSTSQSSNILESQAINIVVNNSAAEIDLSNATTAVAISNSLHSLDGASSSNFKDTMNGDFGSTRVRQSSRNIYIDRFVRVSNVPTASWELLSAQPCMYCRAFRFYRETPSFCCSNGEVSLASITYNPILYHLFTSDCTDIGRRFRRRVRTYNNNLALTSIGMKTDRKYCQNNQGIYTLKVNGQVSHKLEALSLATELPKRLQLFFLDTADDIEVDALKKYDLEPDILNLLLRALSNNPYFKIFKRLRSWEGLQNCRVVLRAEPKLDQKTHNLPTESQIAAIWDETSDEPADMNRDTIVYCAENRAHPILYHYGCFDPLQYPLLFPHGEPGWHAGIERIPQTHKRRANCRGEHIVQPILGQTVDKILGVEEEVYIRNRTKRTNVSCREYACYRCQIRENDFSCIIHSGRLGQQYVIDSYIKIETQRLDYYRMEQQQMDARTETLQGIVDCLAIDGITDPSKVGKCVLLPSSFIGGLRDMMKRIIWKWLGVSCALEM